MIEKMHEINMSELRHLKADEEYSDATNNIPYSVSIVSHSLGGAAMLMYLVTRCLKGLPHRLSRLTLLSPVGFHEDATMIFKLFEYFLPTFAPILSSFVFLADVFM